jgi:hypothetical protein
VRTRAKRAQVTYFYRVPELLDEVCSDGVMSALCGSLVALGLAASEPAAEALLSQHKLEMSRRSLMRYVSAAEGGAHAWPVHAL